MSGNDNDCAPSLCASALFCLSSLLVKQRRVCVNLIECTCAIVYVHWERLNALSVVYRIITKRKVTMTYVPGNDSHFPIWINDLINSTRHLRRHTTLHDSLPHLRYAYLRLALVYELIMPHTCSQTAALQWMRKSSHMWGTLACDDMLIMMIWWWSWTWWSFSSQQ